MANIRDAVRWMREQLGCRQISLVGLRLGGTLAALVASELEIDNLVLWSPVIKGRAYVREMKAISLTAETAPRPAADANGDIEAAGFVLSAETAADLNQIALFGCAPRWRRVLLVSRDDLPEDDRLSNHLSATGLCVEKLAVPGFTEMMNEPHRSRVPESAIGQITTWLTRQISAESVPASLIDINNSATPTTAFMSSINEPTHINSQPHCRESAVRFSTQPDLFGIVCEPTSAVTSDLPLVVLLNAGASHHIGPGRLYVFLARQLAAQGFCTVRLDFCSLGDSIASDSQQENDPHRVMRTSRRSCFLLSGSSSPSDWGMATWMIVWAAVGTQSTEGTVVIRVVRGGKGTKSVAKTAGCSPPIGEALAACLHWWEPSCWSRGCFAERKASWLGCLLGSPVDPEPSPFSSRVGPARFERRPTIMKHRELLAGRYGAAPLTPPGILLRFKKALPLPVDSATGDPIDGQRGFDTRPRISVGGLCGLAKTNAMVLPRRETLM